MKRGDLFNDRKTRAEYKKRIGSPFMTRKRTHRLEGSHPGRLLIAALLLAPLPLSLQACSPEEGPASGLSSGPQVKNLLLITVDALRRDHLSCYGYDAIRTAGIDGLAKEGVQYMNAFSAAPWTCPSMASIFTSLFPEAHGMVMHPIREHRTFRALSPELTTLAEVLKAHDFETHALSEQAWITRAFGFDQGFDNFVELDEENRRLKEEALKILDEVSLERPFFLYLHFLDPHSPYLPPKEFRIPHPGRDVHSLDDLGFDAWWKMLWDMNRDTPGVEDLLSYLISLYDGEILFVDHEISRILEHLEKRGLAEQTMVVLISDHGEGFLEHLMLHGRTLYNEELAVPMIIKIPWEPGLKGVKEEGPVSTLDLMPTLLHVLGLPEPKSLQGRVVVPRRDQAGEAAEEKPVRTARFVYSESAYDRNIKKIQSERFSLIVNKANDRCLFFELEKDTTEQEDVMDLHPDAWKRLWKKVNRWLREEEGWKKHAGPRVEMSKELEERLRALGYLK